MTKMAIIFQEQNHLQDQLRFKGLVNNIAYGREGD